MQTSTNSPMVDDENSLTSKGEDTDNTEGDIPSPSEELRPLVLQANELLQGRREVWIEHGDEMYRLRITSRGKLYLTK